MNEQTITIDPGWCRFLDSDAMEFSEVEISEAGSRQQIRIVANSGKPISGHWHWNNFAIDLEGIEIGRTDKPILLDHEPGSIAGYTSKIAVESDGLVVEGFLLTGDDEAFSVGNRIKRLADEGYPWQASVYVPPEEVEIVPDGVTVEVNGYSLTGPGHVFRKSTLREVTVTSMGADEQTDAELFGDTGRRDAIVSKLTESPEPAVSEAAETPATFAAADVDRIKREAVSAALSEERARVAKLTECAEDRQRALLSELIESDASLADGLERLLKDQRTFRASKLSEMVEEAPEYVGTSETEDVISEEEDEEILGEADQFRANCKAAFSTNKSLRKEFGDFETYFGFCQIDKTVFEGNS